MNIRATALAVAFLMSLPLLGGCNTILLTRELAAKTEEGNTPQTVATPDGRYEVTVTGGWTEDSKQLENPQALRVIHTRRDMVVIVLAESKEEIGLDIGIEEYMDASLEVMQEDAQDVTHTAGVPVTVGGMRGLSAEMREETDDLELIYWLYFLENDDDFVRVVGWTTAEREADNRQAVQNVMQSVKTAELIG
jgi:lipoprotein